MNAKRHRRNFVLEQCETKVVMSTVPSVAIAPIAVVVDPPAPAPVAPVEFTRILAGDPLPTNPLPTAKAVLGGDPLPTNPLPTAKAVLGGDPLPTGIFFVDATQQGDPLPTARAVLSGDPRPTGIFFVNATQQGDPLPTNPLPTAKAVLSGDPLPTNPLPTAMAVLSGDCAANGRVRRGVDPARRPAPHGQSNGHQRRRPAPHQSPSYREDHSGRRSPPHRQVRLRRITSHWFAEMRRETLPRGVGRPADRPRQLDAIGKDAR